MAYKKSKFQQRAKAAASKERTARAAREVKIAERESVRLESAFGSKARLADELVKGGAYTTKTAAKKAIDAMEKGKRLNEQAIKIVGTAKATPEERAQYIEKKVARQERGRQAAVQRKANEQLNVAKELTDQEWLKRRLAGKKAKKVHTIGQDGEERGIVQLAGSGNYIRLIGITSGYGGKGGGEPETFSFSFPMSQSFVSVRTGTREIRTTEFIRGFSSMTEAEQVEELERYYEHMTNGTGQLVAYYYMSEAEHKADHPGRRKKNEETK